MIKLVFCGALRVDMGQVDINANVSSVYEAIKLIQANRPQAIRKWFRTGKYMAVVDGKVVKSLPAMKRELHDDSVIHFCPVVCGSLFGIILAVIAVVLAIAAIALVFMRPKIDDFDKDSKSFQNDVNVSKEGVIVPVVYGGPIRVGTVVLSSDRIVGLDQDSTKDIGGGVNTGSVGGGSRSSEPGIKVLL